MMKKRYAQAAVILASLMVLTVFLLPYLNMAFTSLKPAPEVFRVPPRFLPSSIRFGSYARMVDYLPFTLYLRNSLTVALLSTFISVFVGAFGAYSFSRYVFPFRNFFFLLTLCTRMIPQIVIGVPIYIFFRKLGFIDNILSLVLVNTAFNIPFVIWLMRSFLEGVPGEIDEAAQIDGCSRISTFIRIILPISAPGLATTAIFCFMYSWNEFLFALLLTASKAKTMPVGISEFITIWSIEWGPMAATAVSFSIPVIVFSLFVQRYMVTGLTLGAVKG